MEDNRETGLSISTGEHMNSERLRQHDRPAQDLYEVGVLKPKWEVD